tara:strand:- start:109 stop:576 length:468 start_codon:yes stop_codon:yes gene_type:complete
MKNNKQWSKLQGSIDSLKANKGGRVKKSLNLKATKQAEYDAEQVEVRHEQKKRMELHNRTSFKFNAYGEKIGAYRDVNGEKRQWITIDQAPLEFYKETKPKHYKYCLSLIKDPDVCVERVVPKAKSGHEVTYALKTFKSGKAHNNYTSTRKKTNV